MKAINTIRILTNGGLGDALLLTPSLKSIKDANPTIRIILYCTKKEHCDIFLNNPSVCKIIYLGSISFLKYYDLVRYKLKLIYLNKVDWGSLHPSLFYNIPAIDIIAEMLDIKLSHRNMEVFLSDQEKQLAKAFMGNYKNPVIINPSGKCTLNKEWYIERWEEVIEKLPNFSFIQVGLIEEELIKGAIDLRGKKSLRECMALFAFSHGFVGVESFWGHLTTALNVPGVVLFGPSVPSISGHIINKNLYKSTHCSPCIDILMDAKCPYNKKCLDKIYVDDVVNEIKKSFIDN